MIGWYVHHHGSGHLQRLATVRPHLRHQVTVLSSLERPANWDGDWVQLPWDVTGSPDPSSQQMPSVTDAGSGRCPDPDVTAHGALHWAPLSVPGFADRMRRIANWVSDNEPDAFVVDVSVEVTALVRLLGVRTATVLMPGDRADRPHRLGQDLADLLLGPWPAGAHAVPAGVASRVVAVGAFSRFDGFDLPGLEPVPGRVLVLIGSGGGAPDPDTIDRARSSAGGDWVVRGGRWPHSPDLWTELAEAEVVVCFAGQNSVAEIAAARRPAVVVAAARPYGEQAATVRALQRLGIAVPVDDWPQPHQWRTLFDRAARGGGAAWSRWNPGDGAHRMAAAIEDLAR